MNLALTYVTVFSSANYPAGANTAEYVNTLDGCIPRFQRSQNYYALEYLFHARPRVLRRGEGPCVQASAQKVLPDVGVDRPRNKKIPWLEFGLQQATGARTQR